MNVKNEELKKFIGKFNLNKFGFTDVAPFSDGGIGFSARKSFKGNNIYKTQLSIFVYVESQVSKNSNRKPLIIHATYGEPTEGGIRIRSNPKISDPIDLESRDSYFYDVETGEFYKKNKKTCAEKIIDEIYSKHIKSTQIVRGLWLNFKILFWKFFLRSLFSHTSKFFCWMLCIISGDKYSYEPFFEEETLNGKIIKSRFRPPVEITNQGEKVRENFEESSKIDFFNYKVRHWPIVFYSILHGIMYIIFMLKSYKPLIITAIFKNNFLTVIYVIVTLWFLETIVPKSFIFLIKFFSRLSFVSHNKSISI